MCSQRLCTASSENSFWNLREGRTEETMQRTARHSRSDGPPQDGFAEANLGSRRMNATTEKPLFLDFYPDETGRTLLDAESASPAVTRTELLPVEGLLVT